MEYRFLGKSGLQVSAISLGTMTFGGGEVFKYMGTAQTAEARKMVDICLEAGINLFDTADMYSQGLAEQVLGEAIGQNRRSQVIIATKAFFRSGQGIHDIGSSRLHLIKACEASLKRLGTDYIDLYQVHNSDLYTPLEETLSALDQLIRDGKVRYVGCSNYAGWQLMKALAIADKRGYQPFISQQTYYSLIGRDLENELIPVAVDQHVGTLIWSPLAFGLLSGKYRRGQPMPDNTRLANLEAPGQVNWELLYNIVDELDTIAKERKKTVAQVALNWLLRRPTISSVIFGARTEAQLKDNLGAVGWSLSEEEVRRLEKVSSTPEPYPYWHHHRYAAERNPLIAQAYRP